MKKVSYTKVLTIFLDRLLSEHWRTRSLAWKNSGCGSNAITNSLPSGSHHNDDDENGQIQRYVDSIAKIQFGEPWRKPGVYSRQSGNGKTSWGVNPVEYAADDYKRNLKANPREIKVLFVMSHVADSFYAGAFSRLLGGHPLAEDVWKWIVTEPDLRHSNQGRIFWGFLEKRFFVQESVFKQCCLIDYCPVKCFEQNKETGEVSSLRFNEFWQERDEILSLCNSALTEIISFFNPQLVVTNEEHAYESLQKMARDSIRIDDIPNYPWNKKRNCDIWETDLLKKLDSNSIWAELPKMEHIAYDDSAISGEHQTDSASMLSVLLNLRHEFARILGPVLKGEELLIDPIPHPSKTAVNITRIFNPLQYAWKLHEKYVKLIPEKETKILFVGMNPSPNSPSGIPFFSSESGDRFWRFVQETFGSDGHQVFYRHCYVINYCPLFLMDEGSLMMTMQNTGIGLLFLNYVSDNRNVSLGAFNEIGLPEVLAKLLKCCDSALKEIIDILHPKLIVGIGKYACERVEQLYKAVEDPNKVDPIYMYHPAPYANRNDTYETWIEYLRRQKDGLLRSRRWIEVVEKIKQEEGLQV